MRDRCGQAEWTEQQILIEPEFAPPAPVIETSTSGMDIDLDVVPRPGWRVMWTDVLNPSLDGYYRLERIVDGDEEWEVIGEVPYRTMLFCTSKATMVKKK